MQEGTLTKEQATELQSIINEEQESANKELEDLINSKVEADKSVALEELTEEDMKVLSEEEINHYKIGKILYDDEEERKLNPLDVIPETLLTDEEKFLVSDDNKDEKTKKDTIETLRSKFILSALEISGNLIQKKFNKEASDFMSKTYPGQIVNHYFKQNNRKFNKYTKEELAFNPALEGEGIAYNHTISMDKMLELSKNEVFLNRLVKQCKGKRFTRKIDDLNYFIGRRIGMSKRTYTNSVNILPEFIKKCFFKNFKLDIYALDDQNEHAISRAYLCAMHEIMKKTDVRGSAMVEIYFYNLNVAMLAQLKDHSLLKDDGDVCYTNISEFVMNVYNYFKDNAK